MSPPSLPNHSSSYNRTSPPSHLGGGLASSRTPPPVSLSLVHPSPPPAHSQTPHSFPLPHHLPLSRRHNDSGSSSIGVMQLPLGGGSEPEHLIGNNDQDHSFREHEQSLSLTMSNNLQSDGDNTPRTGTGGANNRGLRMRGRRGRGRNRDRTHQRQLSEMSVRGLDLLRYATLSPDGTYRCIECDRVQITKNFKNKYSFQRHAFLYHEGAARKVFPCTVCKKEFSRPDKMKQHLKQAHAGGVAAVLSPPAVSTAVRQSPSPATTTSPLSLTTVSTTAVSPTSNITTIPSPVTPINTLNSTAVAKAAAAIAAASAAGVPPSNLLVNPFLDLSDPRRSERKVGNLKNASGNHC